MQPYVQEERGLFVKYTEPSPKFLVETCAKCGEYLIPGDMLGFLELYSAAWHLRNDPDNAAMGRVVTFARKAMGYTREAFAEVLNKHSPEAFYTKENLQDLEDDRTALYKIERQLIVTLLDAAREEIAKKL